MSDVLKALERVVAAVKRHLDNGDGPDKILHSVSTIRNQVRDEVAAAAPAVRDVSFELKKETGAGEAEVKSLAERIEAAKTGKDVAALADELKVAFPAEVKTIAQKVGFLKTQAPAAAPAVPEPQPEVEGSFAGGATAITTTTAGDAVVTVTGDGAETDPPATTEAP